MGSPETDTSNNLRLQEVAEKMAELHARNRQESAGLDFSNEDVPWVRSQE